MSFAQPRFYIGGWRFVNFEWELYNIVDTWVVCVIVVLPLGHLVRYTKETYKGQERGRDHSKDTLVHHVMTIVGRGCCKDEEFYVAKNSWSPIWGELGGLMLIKMDTETGFGLAEM